MIAGGKDAGDSGNRANSAANRCAGTPGRSRAYSSAHRGGCRNRTYLLTRWRGRTCCGKQLGLQRRLRAVRQGDAG
jgi:hypothetical protein